jgi:hypothetical protein
MSDVEIFKETELQKMIHNYVLHYTASQEWEQIKDINWTTAEMMEVIEGFHKATDMS